LLLGTAQVAVPQAAQAQLFSFFEGPTSPRANVRVQRRPSAPPAAKAEAETKVQNEKPTNALIAVVSLSDQGVSIYGDDGLIARAPVSTGMAGHRTPTGVFSVIQKSRWHRSNIYSGAPMPYMQRITWSGVALHAGVLPGYPASHGCIRLPTGFAQQLWGMTKIGARVVVTPQHAEAVQIEHANLPVPTMTPAAEDGVADAGKTEIDAGREETPQAVMVALKDGADNFTSASTATAKLLNPAELAQFTRAKTKADAAAAAKSAKAALKLSIETSAEARRAAADLKSAEASLTGAEARLAALEKAAATTKSAEADEKSAAERAAAEARLAEARKRAEEAKAFEAAKWDAAFAAAVASHKADDASGVAEAAAQDAIRALEPISVFISRKEGRLYVRQRWTPLFDVPVAIRNPELPIGTHLFVAMEPAPEGAPLRWMSVTVPESAAGPAASRNARNMSRANPEPAASSAIPETAAGALSRIEVPEDALKRISDRTWTGASLIISDHAMSGETGAYTDFIVTTR
jgi:hypothetical protein